MINHIRQSIYIDIKEGNPVLKGINNSTLTRKGCCLRTMIDNP